jgi:chromosome segregation ATPase
MGWGILGVLGGALLGGGAVWWWLSVRLRRLNDERADLQRTLRERRNEAFRAATGMGGDTNETNADPPDRLRTLQEKNAELRERNETLEQQLAEVKERIRTLRDAE